ncbi:replication initiation protein (plasmid) [Pseudomonas amygdali pv. morsprunorum]|uniref:replication initiation protein n=1 Tax=Pseudomonas savastanoi TaxID=29438 RepID=UPI000CD1E4FD|nr:MULTISPECIES: replication initiation protein [Pseudomonas syringae group genomosp. 2]POY47941.1 replication initiator protein [Pseudomonas amygdali pv. morsprunorum]
MIDNKVTQSNKLVEASHTLTLNEKRLVLCAASLIAPGNPFPKDGYLTIRADTFAQIFGIDVKHAYGALEDAAARLFNRDIRRYVKGKLVERMRWVFHVKYKEGQGCVELGFSPTVLPHLTMLHTEFTSYQLRQIGSLSSFYAVRLYELMSQFRKTKQRECTLSQLREMLDLGEKYPNVKDLRRWVIDPAIAEVNKHTDLTVTVEPRRQGRRIIGFSFTITKNDQMALNLQ